MSKDVVLHVTRIAKYAQKFVAKVLIVALTIVLVPHLQMASHADTFIDDSSNCTSDISSSAGIANSNIAISWYRDDLGEKDYCVVQFKTVGKTYEWATPDLVSSIDILLIGGGGRGGEGNWYGGGGGAGGFIEANTLVVPSSIYQISVGKGATYSPSANSGNSTFSYNNSNIFTALGGGNGASNFNAATSGGSGGGGNNKAVGAASSNSNQGNNGGRVTSIKASGSGGGGAGGVGRDGVDGGSGGNGGPGKSSSISGTSITYAGGGGGVKATGASFTTGQGGTGGGGRATNQYNSTLSSDFALSGTANTGGGGGGAGNATGNDPGNGGTGIVIIRYEIDLTAPVISEATFQVVENETTAGTLIANEAVSWSITGGADLGFFSINSSSGVLTFDSPPDYELPSGSLGNTYSLQIGATDLSGNSSSKDILVVVQDVLDTSNFNSLSLEGSITSANFRTAINIVADVSVNSKVTFRLNGRVIPGCRKILTNEIDSSFEATCNWRPSMRGSVTLDAVANPIASGISNSSCIPMKIWVNRRTGPRQVGTR